MTRAWACGAALAVVVTGCGAASGDPSAGATAGVCPTTTVAVDDLSRYSACDLTGVLLDLRSLTDGAGVRVGAGAGANIPEVGGMVRGDTNGPTPSRESLILNLGPPDGVAGWVRVGDGAKAYFGTDAAMSRLKASGA